MCVTTKICVIFVHVLQLSNISNLSASAFRVSCLRHLYSLFDKLCSLLEVLLCTWKFVFLCGSLWLDHGSGFLVDRLELLVEGLELSNVLWSLDALFHIVCHMWRLCKPLICYTIPGITWCCSKGRNTKVNKITDDKTNQYFSLLCLLHVDVERKLYFINMLGNKIIPCVHNKSHHWTYSLK